MESNSLQSLPISIQQVHNDLKLAYSECQLRSLHKGCKWISDLIFAMGENLTESEDVSMPQPTIPINGLLNDDPLQSRKAARLSFAKSLLATREYAYCADLLAKQAVLYKPSSAFNTIDALSAFYYYYARYMTSVKRSADSAMATGSAADVLPDASSSKRQQASRPSPHHQLISLRTDLEERQLTDPYLAYVHVLVLAKLSGSGGDSPDLVEQAMGILVDCVLVKLPWFWPAWFELSQLIGNRDQLSQLMPRLPSTDQAWMRYFFEAKVSLKLHEGDRALDILTRLSNSGFSHSPNLQAELASAYDELRDMTAASDCFKRLFTDHPSRLDTVDIYSNVLFVREDTAELAYQANRCVSLDRYRPETCCVVGNFFSLRGDHCKAVLYFRTALQLKPGYSLVWTLVGHEYTELHNINAAVNAYRHAIKYNQHDFRAWYGLGQMYELLNMPSFAIYYYREAQFLVPTDSRLIVALGEIYEKLGRIDEAKKCYYRAYAVGDIEGIALLRFAQCFDRCHGNGTNNKVSCDSAEAAAAYTEYIKLCDRSGIHNQSDLAQAYRYLAVYHLQVGHYEDAATAANKCFDFPETREEAKSLFRQITSLAGNVETEIMPSIDLEAILESMGKSTRARLPSVDEEMMQGTSPISGDRHRPNTSTTNQEDNDVNMSEGSPTTATTPDPRHMTGQSANGDQPPPSPSGCRRPSPALSSPTRRLTRASVSATQTNQHQATGGGGGGSGEREGTDDNCHQT